MKLYISLQLLLRLRQDTSSKEAFAKGCLKRQHKVLSLCPLVSSEHWAMVRTGEGRQGLLSVKVKQETVAGKFGIRSRVLEEMNALGRGR